MSPITAATLVVSIFLAKRTVNAALLGPSFVEIKADANASGNIPISR
jgi:hypothetical protein